MYYFLPKAAERPVFSYKLSIIHFWSLVFIYIWAGPHHLHYTSVAAWASSLGNDFFPDALDAKLGWDDQWIVDTSRGVESGGGRSGAQVFRCRHHVLRNVDI